MKHTSQEFISYLQWIHAHNKTELCHIRRNLSLSDEFSCESDFIDCFCGIKKEIGIGRYYAYYITLRLFAIHPKCNKTTLGHAMQYVYKRQRCSEVVDRRFLSVFDNRFSISRSIEKSVLILKRYNVGLDYIYLLDDLIDLFECDELSKSDLVRRRWAEDFYGF